MRSNGASIALTASFHKVNIYLESHCDHSSTSRAAGSVVPAQSVPRMPRRGRDIAVARTEAPHPQWSKWLSFGSYFVRNDALSCMFISFGHMAPESGRVALNIRSTTSHALAIMMHHDASWEPSSPHDQASHVLVSNVHNAGARTRAHEKYGN